jgi:hypothetical protein
MKTFRQELRNWLKERKKNEVNSDQSNLLEEIIVKINELEKLEEDIINRAYYQGHMDCENKKNLTTNYYRNTHKAKSFFRQMLKKIK